MKLAWLALPFLVSASVPAQDKPLEPVGIRNLSVNCYFLALFQVLLYTRSFSSLVLGHHSSDAVHSCLASFFTRLLTAPQWGAAISIETELMPVMEAVIRKEGERYFKPGAMDDPHAVLVWLLEQHLPWVAEALLTVKTHSQLFLGDLPLGDPRVEEANHLQAHVVQRSRKFVDELVLRASEEILEEYTIDPNECTEATKAALAQKGITEVTVSSKVVKRVTVVETPPVLVIHVNKFGFKDGEMTWSSTPVKYRSSFVFAPPKQPAKTYHLHAIIAYEKPSHYVA